MTLYRHLLLCIPLHEPSKNNIFFSAVTYPLIPIICCNTVQNQCKYYSLTYVYHKGCYCLLGSLGRKWGESFYGSLSQCQKRFVLPELLQSVQFIDTRKRSVSQESGGTYIIHFFAKKYLNIEFSSSVEHH